jgi:hypothetical protein
MRYKFKEEFREYQYPEVGTRESKDDDATTSTKKIGRRQSEDDASTSTKESGTRQSKEDDGASTCKVTGTISGIQLHQDLKEYIQNLNECKDKQANANYEIPRVQVIVNKIKAVFREYEKNKRKKESENDDNCKEIESDISKVTESKEGSGNEDPKEKDKNGNSTKKYDLHLLQSEFSLRGYMIHKIENKTSQIYFWNGNADAIGWYEDNYVIIEWKEVKQLQFWTKHADAYGKFLHQCLVYARLLKLHLELPKLPYILLVPISNDFRSEEDIRPGLFDGIPEQCTKQLAKFEWVTSLDEYKPEVVMNLPSTLIDDDIDHNGFVDTQTPLYELFKKDRTITVKNLLDALGFAKLKVVKEKSCNQT